MENLDVKTYLPIFIEESKDNIQQMSANLLLLEQNHGDIDAINEIFRAIHTIKGMSATMGYTDISNLAHEAENLLDDVRHNKISISSGMINGFFAVIDELETQIVVLEQTSEAKPIPAQRIKEIIALFSDLDGSVAGKSQTEFRLEIVFSRDCMLRPARAIVILNQLDQSCTVLHTDPPRETLPTLEDLSKFVCHICAEEPGLVKAVLEDGIEIESYSFQAVSAKEASPDSLQIPVAAEDFPRESQAVLDSESGKLIEPHIFKNAASVRVDTEKLDRLLNLVSELVINKTSIQDAAADYFPLADGVEHLHRLTADLQTIVMNMRMIPLETVFNRFPRMIRDTAKSLDKNVALEIQGAETELDRTIIEDIADPLMHLLRNAVDHGIESVEERTRLGKAAMAKITLRAYQTGNQVVIEVTDDGYGLDLPKIRAKARKLNLWQDHEPDREELANFIFAPGFTTSDSVTDLSGRGVGLDVVKGSIESLGGIIEVISYSKVGTTFRIFLPLTLAIIQGLLVKAGTEIYVIPLSYVWETEIIYPDSIQTVGQQQVVMLRGQVLPIVFAAKLLGVEDYVPPEEMSLVVVRYGDRQVGLIVDDLLTQQDIVIKNVSWGHRFFNSFLGSTILGNGNVVLILDINNLLSGAKVREVEQRA